MKQSTPTKKEDIHIDFSVGESLIADGKRMRRFDSEPIFSEKEMSPRTQLLRNKFKNFREGEFVIGSYSCTVTMTLVLAGMLYVTNRNIYFYTPLNSKMGIGYGTKVTIPYL